MLANQFTDILEKEKNEDLIPLLRSLTGEQKKELSQHIKALAKEYFNFFEVKSGTGYTYRQKATDKQKDILLIGCFVCMSRADFEKISYPGWILEDHLLDPVIDWYCPDWFSDFVNRLGEKDNMFYTFNYDLCIKLVEKGVLQPSKRLVVSLLPQTIYEYGDKRPLFKPEKLLRYPVILNEHIWYLFEVESNVHYSGRYMNFGENVTEEEVGWIAVIKKYMAEGRIDRSRLLKESLLASNRNFNKVLSGWFSELFAQLEPAKDEVLSLQNELLSVLSSPHSKPVNTALSQVKKILAEKQFDTGSFLDAVPVLLSSGVKATVSATLVILEKLVQKHTEYRQKIVGLVCQSFIHPDEELQAKAARIIVKYADSSDAAFRHELAAFYPSLLVTAKQLLAGFHPSEGGEEKIAITPIVPEPVPEVSSLPAEIPLIETIDDLVFLASQAFDNNEPWHIDVLPAALIQFRSRLRTEDLPRLEPAFQRAFGLIKNAFRSTTGHLDHMLAIFFIDFGNWLIRNFPGDSEGIIKLYRIHDRKEGDKETSWLVSPDSGSYISTWDTNSKIAFYQPYKQLLMAALQKIQQGSSLPVLSTPTYTTGGISPGVLIDRLHAYQTKRQEPDSMDLQVAISRCFPQNDPGLAEYAAQKLTGEWRDLVTFLLVEEAVPRGRFHNKAAWMVASLTKKEKKAWKEFEAFSYYKKPLKNYTGQLQWSSGDETYTVSRYEHTGGKFIEKKVQQSRKVLRVQRDYSEAEKGGLRKMISKILPPAKDDPPMLYEFLNYRAQYLGSEHNDIRRILSLIPSNPEPVLADTINQCLKYPNFWGETDKKMTIAVLQVLYEVWSNPGDMAYLFLGTSLLAADKTVANIAGEIWLKAVAGNRIDDARLGKVIGQHERVEFAPLKRFTDLVTQSLFRVSDLHNRELQTLIEHILTELPDEPVKNLKKLLEIYGELTVTNKTPVSEPAIFGKLKAWQKTAGLQRITGILTATRT